MWLRREASTRWPSRPSRSIPVALRAAAFGAIGPGSHMSRIDRNVAVGRFGPPATKPPFHCRPLLKIFTNSAIFANSSMRAATCPPCQPVPSPAEAQGISNEFATIIPATTSIEFRHTLVIKEGDHDGYHFDLLLVCDFQWLI